MTCSCGENVSLAQVFYSFFLFFLNQQSNVSIMEDKGGSKQAMLSAGNTNFSSGSNKVYIML